MAIARVLENPIGAAKLRVECHALFPTPGAIERYWLYRALGQIATGVPWLPPHLGHDALVDELNRLAEAAYHEAPPAQRYAQPAVLSGDFGMYGAMIGTGLPVQPKGLLALRGLLWTAARWCRETGRPYLSAAEDFARTLRAVAKSPTAPATRALSSVIARLGQALSLEDAIEAVDVLDERQHQTLFRVWRLWLEPTLSEIALGARPGIEPRVLTQGPIPPDHNQPKTSPANPKQRRQDRERPERNEPSVQILRRRFPYPGQLPGEPTEEFSGADALVSVPGYGTGAKNRKQAEYHASQAIWGGNSLHLTNHIDVLPTDVYRAAVGGLVSQLERLDVNHQQAVGAVGCLLKAITGRTTKGILALELRPVAWGEKLSGWVLDLDEGWFAIPVFWKAAKDRAARQTRAGERHAEPGYFRATSEQRQWLVPVIDHITLPLTRPLRKALGRHREIVESIRQLGEAPLDSRMSDAAEALADEIGVPVGVAALRRSLSAQLVERTGDPAQAQLICGDSFGATDAHQHYYAPRRKDLADVYFGLFNEMLEPSPAPRIPEPGTRVGSELLVSAESAKRLARVSAEQIPPELGSEDALERVIGEHRRLLDHLVRMLLATSGHRPAEALFEITLADIDLETGAALFRDKRHDLAHDPRLARLPAVVIKQIGAYLRHLDLLAAQHGQLAPEIRLIRTGSAPFLFDLDREGKHRPLALQAIADRSPREWAVVPWNWGRTYLRTRALEMGAPAFLVAAQLGHYDSIGYPYSNQSPTDPVEVLEAAKPWLDRVAATQGWTVLESGLPDERRATQKNDRRAGEHDIHPVPLRDWRPVIDAVERAAAGAHWQWERAVRSDARRSREEAEQAVLAHPQLERIGVSDTFRNTNQPALIEPLSSLDIERIRTELVLDCGDDVGAALARTRALRRVLRTVAEVVKQPTPTLPLPLAVRRPLDNAFFTGACQAFTQVHALREHVRSRSTQKRPQRSWRLQVARTVEALALFGWIDSAETLRAVLAARTLARPSAKIPDLMLVPVGEGQTIALRGVAALALANLAQSFPDEELPDSGDLDEALATLLPPWATAGEDGPRGILMRLCSTISVSNRFELSPAARFAMDPERGSTQTTLAEQLAFIDSDPVGPPRAEALVPASTSEPPPLRALPSPEVRERTSSARDQYRRLIAKIPSPSRALVLPLTSRTVPATAIQTSQTRQLVVAELDEWIARSDSARGEQLWPIVRMLADWTRAELIRLKPDGDLLADRSVSTYLSRIGRALVDELGSLDAAHWTELDFEQAYAYALFLSEDAKHKVAAALLSFHEHCAARFDLPEVDIGGVYAHLGKGQRNVDAAMILPVEREAALAELEQRAWEDGPGGLAATRVARLADFAAVFLGHAGARLNEPLGLQVRDVALRPSGELWTRIRPNRLRSVKTRAARRLIQFGPRCTVDHHARAWRWVDSVRRRAGATRPGGAYLTAGLGTPAEFAEHSAVADLIRQTLARATGRRTERLHRLRHLVSTEALAQRVLSAEDAEWTRHPVMTELTGRPLQPRDLHALCVPIGHAHWMTTIQWYLHIPLLLQSRAAARLRKLYFGRQVVAAALGYTPFSLDAILRGGADDTLRQWFNHFRPGRSLPEITQPPKAAVEPQPSAWQWTTVRVAQLVEHARKSKDLMAALVLLGAPLSEADRIEECVAKWELKLGLRLVPEFVGERRRDCPPRAVRRMDEDALIEGLWRMVDDAESTHRDDIRRIAQDFYLFLMPGSDHRILLPRSQASKLTDVLGLLGIPLDQVVCEPTVAGMSRLEVRRSSESRAVRRYRGLGIKRVLAVVGFAADLCGPQPRSV